MIHFAGGRQSGAILYNAFGVMGNSDTGGQTGMSKSNGSTGSQTGSGYSTDMSDDNLPQDAVSPVSDVNEHSDSDDQVMCQKMFGVKMSFVKMYLKAVLVSASDLLRAFGCCMQVPFRLLWKARKVKNVEQITLFTCYVLLFNALKDEGVESDDVKKDLPLMPPPPDSSSMKLTIRQIWFSFAAPTNVRSPSQAISR